jgi:F0F1-type ATP synthase membrane subunit b/b'
MPPMDSWLIYTALTVAYIIILIVYFLRRSRSHEKELQQFLSVAKSQLQSRENEINATAQQKISKAMLLIKKVHDTAAAFEKQAQKEYDQIIEDAKVERQDLLAKTKTEIDLLFKQADREIAEYKANRYKEVEKNMVKLVIAVTQKVVGKSLSESDHKQLIYDSLDEVIQKKSHND